VNDLKTIEYLNKYGLESLSKKFGLKTKIYDDRVVLNYGIDCKPKDKTLLINRECRQLIVHKNEKDTWEVVSQSFLRFFNLYENDINDFEFDYAEEKVDGSIISLYKDMKENFCWATRSTAFAEAKTHKEKPFLKLCEKAAEKARLFSPDHLGQKSVFYSIWNRYELLNLIFELTGPENRVVKKYNDCSLTLIGGRAVSLRELRRYELDYIASHLRINRPKIFDDLKNIEQVLDFVEDMPAKEEGFVLVKTCGESYFNHSRMKVKNKAYVELAYMRNGGVLTNRRIVNIIKKGDLEEYLSYFPEDEESINPIKIALKNNTEKLNNIWEKVKKIEEQKEFAMTIKKHTLFTSPLFAKKKDNKLDMETFILSLSTDNVLKQIGIKING